jgi:tetratricopeptide (TPR) repeat protein
MFSALWLGASPVAGAQPAAPVRQSVLARDLVRSLHNAYQYGTDVDTVRVWRTRLAGNAAMLALLDGTMFRLAFQEDSSTARYREAARDTLAPGAPYALVGLANTVANHGEFREALALLAQATRLLVQQGDSTGQSEALMGRALLAMRVYGVDSARSLMGQATALIPARDAWLLARAGCTQLQVEVRAGAKIADSVWQSRERAAGAQGPVLHSTCLFGRAQYLDNVGLADASLALLDTVALLQRASRQWSNVAATLQWQGTSLIARGRYREAQDKLEASRRAARSSASVSGEAWATLQLGEIDRRLGSATDAIAHFKQSRALMVKMGDATGMAYADLGVVELMHNDGLLAVADSQWRELLPRVDRVAPQIAVQGVIARSDIARRTGRLAAGVALLDTAAALITSRNMPGWRAEWRYANGLSELARGFPDRAIAQWDTLLREHRNIRPPVRFEVVSRWAEAQATLGRFDPAWRNFLGGALSLDRWRLSLSTREQALAAVGDRQFDWDRDLGFATTTALFAKAGRTAEALAMAEWRRLRAAQQIELQRGALAVESTPSSGTVVRVVDSSRVDPARLPTLARARLLPSQAVVAYMTGRGGEPTTAFVLTRDTLISVPLPPIDSVSASITLFSAFLQAGALPAELAANLSAQLLTPALRSLPAAVTRVILVPDGDLHRLPFAALQSATGQSVLERYELATAPSVEDALGGAVSVARRAGASSVVVGAPAQMPRNAATGMPWGALPGAALEARQVARLLGESEVLAGTKVTRDAVTQRFVRGGPVLHVATHAVATPASFVNNGLVLQPSPNDDGFLSLSELRAQPLPFDLVVLSACASGEGVMLAGQSLHGLVSTALDAGARGVIATRWALDDTAIVSHMVSLYKGLQRGEDVVTAVHRVRRDAMRAGVSPAIWANLEYVGDPTLRVTFTPLSPWWSRVGHTMRGWLRAVGLE